MFRTETARGLQTIFTELIDIADTRADSDIRATFQNTDNTEVDFLGVSALKGAELVAWIDPHHGQPALHQETLCGRRPSGALGLAG